MGFLRYYLHYREILLEAEKEIFLNSKRVSCNVVKENFNECEDRAVVAKLGCKLPFKKGANGNNSFKNVFLKKGHKFDY